MKKVLVICGPTASGKTALAVECAQKLHSEVISADSMIVYKDLAIGTAKPTEAEMQGVIHHMVGVVDPKDNFSVSDFERAALPVIDRLHAEGKIPVVCGGTGFYINALLFAQGFGKTDADAAVRKRYEAYAEEQGKEALFALLRERDAQSAAKLHPNDVKRVIRALEILEVTGEKKSAQADSYTPRFDYTAVCIDYPREKLYERIERRVDIMLEQGLIDEVKNLFARGIDETCQCMQGIGYKEVLAALRNPSLMPAVADTIKLNTRHYAKRQITFFKKLPGLHNLSPDGNLTEETLQWLQK